MNGSGNVIELEQSREAPAPDAQAAWQREWLKFPTVRADEEGCWHFWEVPADTGCYQDDWPLGEKLARETVLQMQRFPQGGSVLRRILRDMEYNSTVAQGFLNRLEDMLTYPDLYLKCRTR